MAEKIDPRDRFIPTAHDEPGLLEQLHNRLIQPTTPDYLERKLEGYIPVFVYGTLRKGFHNHGYVDNFPFLGSAHTTLEKFEMRDAGSSSFPVVFERDLKVKGKKRNPVVGKIKGEVYVVDPKALLALDRLENNGKMYTRSLQWVFLSQQSVNQKATIRPSIRCWMYIGNPNFWQGRGGQEAVRSKMTNGVKTYDWSDTFESSWTDEDYLANANSYVYQ